MKRRKSAIVFCTVLLFAILCGCADNSSQFSPTSTSSTKTTCVRDDSPPADKRQFSIQISGEEVLVSFLETTSEIHNGTATSYWVYTGTLEDGRTVTCKVLAEKEYIHAVSYAVEMDEGFIQEDEVRAFLKKELTYMELQSSVFKIDIRLMRSGTALRANFASVTIFLSETEYIMGYVRKSEGKLHFHAFTMWTKESTKDGSAITYPCSQSSAYPYFIPDWS